MKKGINKILHIMKQREFLMLGGICLLFFILLLKFFQLQIIEYDEYSSNLRASVERTIEIPATRGLIFDRYGRPLATNKPMYVLKVDQQVKMEKGQLNQVLLEVANLLEANGDEYVDTVPITKTPPFEYTGSKTDLNQFVYSIPYNNEEHRQEILGYSAKEMIDYLRSSKVFNIDPVTSDIDARKIIALRVALYKSSYSKYKLVTVANNISEKTVAQIEESHNDFPGVLVEVEPIRYYTEGEVMGNILGYTRSITENQYEEMKEKGYDRDDVVGHEGIEKSMEEELRGEKGLEHVEVDSVGRKVHTIEKEDAVQGNDVFLTIDLDLQKVAYESIEKRLSESVIEQIKGQRKYVLPLTARDILTSMVESSQLQVSKMKVAEEGSKQKEIYNKLIKEYEMLDEVVRQDMSLEDLLLQWMKEEPSPLTDKEVILALHEQGTLKLPSETVTAIKNNSYGSAEHIIISQLETGNLKPNQFAVGAFSGAAVVVDVNTGEVLSMVGYPSYDSNQMTNNFNRYYNTLFDSRSMLWNRALMTTKAPGSIFKMITGIAGLEEGVVTPGTVIYDRGEFTKAGAPYPKCWIYGQSGHTHGPTDLARAVTVSCNYYMYELAYNLGRGSNDPYANINTLNKYVEMFGLNKKTGIELRESEPNVSTPENLVQRQITSVLNAIKTMDEERKIQRVESVAEQLGKGIYPNESSNTEQLDAQIDYLIQYELKRNLEPLLQDALEKDLNQIINASFESIQGQLQTKLPDVVSDIVVNTMNDMTKRSLKSKTKDQLIKHLNYMVDTYVEDLIVDAVETIPLDEIVEVYDHAYTTIYNRELKKATNPTLVQELKKRIETLEQDKDYYIDYIAIKVKESLVDKIASHLLAGVDIEWSDGITIRTAIGQGNNAFTPVQMARYIAALANGKTVYDLKIVNGIYDSKGNKRYEPLELKKYKDLDLKESTLQEIYKGMLEVTKSAEGTARTVFSDFPIDVASKTGTAQEGKYEHAWFVGFAPYDDPQIAIVTTIYNANGLGSYNMQIARDILTSYFKLNQTEEETTLDNMFIN
ncbi:MAG: penicillin-binding transpeptidase domain-containing protein [Cellulosilyticaceae bacterium]